MAVRCLVSGCPLASHCMGAQFRICTHADRYSGHADPAGFDETPFAQSKRVVTVEDR